MNVLSLPSRRRKRRRRRESREVEKVQTRIVLRMKGRKKDRSIWCVRVRTLFFERVEIIILFGVAESPHPAHQRVTFIIAKEEKGNKRGNVRGFPSSSLTRDKSLSFLFLFLSRTFFYLRCRFPSPFSRSLFHVSDPRETTTTSRTFSTTLTFVVYTLKTATPWLPFNCDHEY